MKKVNYGSLAAQAEALVKDVPHRTANLANLSSLVFHELGDVNWAGFYFIEGDRLVLGPFQGKVACIEIPLGRGVCGTAAAKDETQLVPDVNLFEGHIACDCASRSEIVIPLHSGGKVTGVLDIDSAVPARFSETDREGLEKLAAVIEQYI